MTLEYKVVHRLCVVVVAVEAFGVALMVRAWASRSEVVPVSMIWPANVNLSTMAAHSRGSR